MTAIPRMLGSGTPCAGSRALHCARRAIRSAPLTFAYLLVLVATTGLLSSESAQSDDRLLLELSTNLHQLAHDPVRVLVGSVFWTSGWPELALWATLFAAVLVPVERRLGGRRVALAFGAGHVGATLVVAGGLWIALRLGVVPSSISLERDVGASYGFVAVAALASYLLGPRQRVLYLTVLLGYVLASAALSHTFTDFGHLVAVAIGLACRSLARPRAAPRQVPGLRNRFEAIAVRFTRVAGETSSS